MRKITFLMALLAVFWGTNTFAQTWVEDVYLYDDFGTTGGTTSGNWVNGTSVYGNAIGVTTASGNTFGSAINTSNKNAVITSKVYNNTFISNVKTFTTNYSSPSNKLTIEYICKVGAGQTYSGGYYYFRDNNNKPIFGLGFARLKPDNINNKWSAVRLPSYVEYINGAASYSNISDRITLFGTSLIESPALKITAIIDFGLKTYSLNIISGTYTPNGSPEWIDGTPTYSNSSLPFLDNTATNVSNILFEANGSGNTSVSTATNFTFDNFKIAGEKESNGVGNVTVKYVDVADNSAIAGKSDVSHIDLNSGQTYTSTTDEKANFTIGGFYYVYDASNTTDNVLVTENTTTDLTLKFKKYPVISNSILTWTGTTNGTLNELNSNFTSDGINSVGFQSTNGITLPAVASNKSISLNSALEFGANDLNINGTGYTLTSGVLGSLNGTGAMKINLSSSDVLTLNSTNNLTGTSQITGGIITLNKSGALGSAANVTGSSTFTSGVGQAFPATTFGASSTIQGAGYINSINGITAGSGVKVSISSTHNTANDYAFDFAASGTLSAGSELELNGLATAEAKFGMTSASTTYLADTKVSLKGNAFLFIDGSQGAATTINVGLLNGETNAKLGWGKTTALDRDITWSVGATNENSEFAGTITNIGAYRGSGRMYVGDYTNITKEGTGKLTLSGTSTSYNGHLTVNNGELLISGNLQGNNQGAATVIDLVTYNNGPKANTVTVAAGKKLSVTGSLTATNLVINSDANGTGTLVNTGTVAVTNATVKQYLTEGRNWYFTAPVSNATSGVVNATAGNKLFMYDENTAKWIQIVRTDSVLQAGRGYIAQIGTGNTGALTFTGTLNDGNVQTTVSRLGTTKAGFNLVGNPYPSYLNWKACIEDADNVANAKVSTSVWYRTKTAGGAYTFATYNATSNMGTNVETLPATDIVTGNIPPMQAFWVRVNEGQTTGTLTFKNAMRAHKGSQVQGDAVSRNDGKLRAPALQQVLRLQVSNGINSDEAIILFNNSASNSLDMYDSYKMSNNSASIPEIYTSVGSENLVINGLQSYDFNTVLPLGFKAGETNQYVISASQISNFDTDTKIYLRDNATGTQTDLTVGDAYSFTSDATATDSRFSVLFRSAAGTTDLINAHQDVKVYAVDNQIFVENSGSLKSVSAEVFNAVGQKVYNQLLNSDINQLSKEFASGAYVVKINDGAQAVAYKLIVR